MRLVKRYSAGAWIQAGLAVTDGASKIIGSIFAAKKAEQERIAAADNKKFGEAMERTATLRALAAQAASKFDRGAGSVSDLVLALLRIEMPPMGYENGSITPYPLPQSNAVGEAASSVAQNVVGSLFKKKSGGTSEGTVVTASQPDLSLQGELKTPEPTEESPGVLKGNLTASQPDPGQSPSAAPDKDKDLKALAEELRRQALTTLDKSEYYNLINKAIELEKLVSSAKNGCKLKKRFNPRLFKKQK